MSFLEGFLGQFVNNVNFVIQVMVVVIAFLFVVLLGLYIRKKEGTSDLASDGQVKGLEETLKKVLEQAQSTIAHVEGSNALSGPGVANSGDGEPAEVIEADPQEILQLKAMLKEREDELLLAKQQTSVDLEAEVKLKEYLSKISDLEGRLMEYEIIEDDIADLSKFKEENAMLKTELDALKSGGATAAPSAEPPAGEAEASDEAVVDEPVSEVTEPVEAAQGTADEPIDPVAAAQAEIDAEASEEPKSSDEPELAVEASADDEPEDEGEEEEDEDPANLITDDILAEFSAAIDEEYEAAEEKTDDEAPAIKAAPEEAQAGPAAEATSDELLAAIDTEKMVAEMADLSEADDDALSVLEEESNIDKMAEEASKLE